MDNWQWGGGGKIRKFCGHHIWNRPEAECHLQRTPLSAPGNESSPPVSMLLSEIEGQMLLRLLDKVSKVGLAIPNLVLLRPPAAPDESSRERAETSTNSFCCPTTTLIEILIVSPPTPSPVRRRLLQTVSSVSKFGAEGRWTNCLYDALLPHKRGNGGRREFHSLLLQM